MTTTHVGNFYNNSSIEIHEIEGRKYALHGWNGEFYLDCWEVADKYGHDRIDSGVIEIAPIYDFEDEQMPIIGYQVR